MSTGEGPTRLLDAELDLQGEQRTTMVAAITTLGKQAANATIVSYAGPGDLPRAPNLRSSCGTT